MAVHAHLMASAAAGRDPRRTLQLEAAGTTATGDPAHVLIHNISATGLLLETNTELAVGQALRIDLPRAEATAATVVWKSGRIYGCQFDRAISSGVLSAAQLRGAVGTDLAVRSRAATGSDFGNRLQRLREQRGLSLGALASRVGVSKPTVWAWERGKARPIERRLASLATALDIDPADLVAADEQRAIQDTVDRCRAEIAAAVGLDSARVKVTIEF